MAGATFFCLTRVVELFQFSTLTGTYVKGLTIHSQCLYKKIWQERFCGLKELSKNKSSTRILLRKLILL